MKKRLSKKGKRIIVFSIIGVFVVAVAVFLGVFMMLNRPMSNASEIINYEVKAGDSVDGIVEDLLAKGIIRSSLHARLVRRKYRFVYPAVGIHEIDKGKTTMQIIEDLLEGGSNGTVKMTFIEGQRLNKFVEQIANTYNYTEEEIMNFIQSAEFLNEMITNYWFITDDVKNTEIYYALEGYLFPDTYEFSWNASIKDVFVKILNNTSARLAQYQEKIEASDYSVSQILAMASIVELEGVQESDRKNIARVIYNRLDAGMNLGMDVTAYYAAKVEMSELWTMDIQNFDSPYNTRLASTSGKLPVGPICNPSAQSINAVLNPNQNTFLYFYADVKTGEVYFSSTYAEHLQTIKEVG